MPPVCVPSALRQTRRAVVFVVQLLTLSARAQSVRPNTVDSARSYTIVQTDWSLWQKPASNAPHRGALSPGAHITPFAELLASGCQLPWWLVGPDAWMCPDNATLSESTSSAGNFTAPTTRAVLGHVLVGSNGTLGYDRRENVDVGTPSAEMRPGFMLGYVEAFGTGDSAVLLTTHGFWVPARDVQHLKPSDFQGATVDGDLDLAWVFTKHAQVYSGPDVRRRPPQFIDRLTQVVVQGQQQRTTGLWLKFEGGWLKATELRMPELQAPPTGIGIGEHWIDIDTKTQTLIAYVGPRPVYATLVSTGKGKLGTEQSTPIGTHRVWVKLIQSDMDNLDTAEAKSVYAVEAVPHVMFFQDGYGIHGTYWHDDFGLPKSHGCVNVSPADSRWLFQFIGPHLPRGWSAVFPTAIEPGTVIRIR